MVWNIDRPGQVGAIARAGEFGVSIFFFLSSYLITELLLREKRDTGTILIPAFYVRRILRIWPLYFTMIAAGAFVGHFSSTHTLSLAWCLSLLLLFTNWYTLGTAIRQDLFSHCGVSRSRNSFTCCGQRL